MNPEWVAEIVDVEGAYLQGEFTEGEEIHIEVPQGFEEYYDEDYVLKRNVPLYGMKQAASCFYEACKSCEEKKLRKEQSGPMSLFYMEGW